MSGDVAPSLPYHEPGITTILLNSSFLLLLNVVNLLLDKTLYCGLLGQVFIGVAFGTPGAKWLGTEVEHVIVQLGYLGLLLLVFEGGLSTSFKSLKANFFLSVGIAVTGIVVPMALSFVLMSSLARATPLQAFAAGAALCSTSLGTTFTVLGTSGLTQSRLGVALTSAAMMDDVVGLIMVEVISRLGGSNTSISATTIVRPVLVSIAFAVVAPLVCSFIVKPLTVVLNDKRSKSPTKFLNKIFMKRETSFVIHTLILVGLVAGSTYAGSSNLYASYIAGACISWWDTEVAHVEIPSTTDSKKESEQIQLSTVRIPLSGLDVYHTYYYQCVERILKPLFFASIGFSIPITRMFSGPIVWRGIIYTILMAFGKLVCGLWLISIQKTPRILVNLRRRAKAIPWLHIPHYWGPTNKKIGTTTQSSTQIQQTLRQEDVPSDQPRPTTREQTSPSSSSNHTSPNPSKPLSLYPASILGCAMVARGEIGFLISAIAESNGIFSSGNANEASGSSPIFLIVTWAIVMCTILGPVGVGLLVRRVKRLQEGVKKNGQAVREDVLGVWGVS